MQSYRANATVGEPFPAHCLRGSAVARLLHARRGVRDGLTIAEIAARLSWSATAVTYQLAILAQALARVGSDWQVWCDGVPEAYGVAAPWCPRPPPRVLPVLPEPELISLSDLSEEFPA
jgi:hypothetical protein